jgi:hypothetical protein
VVFAGRCAACHEDVASLGDGFAQKHCLIRSHDPGTRIVVECEDRDGRLADRESRRRDDGWQQSLEPLSRSGQFGGDAGIAGMDLGADVMCDEADDALAISRHKHRAGVE